MGVNGHTNGTNGKAKDLRFIPLSYNNGDSQTSAMRLLLALRPEWESAKGEIQLVRFTDGITNTLLKAVLRNPDLTDDQIDQEAVLLRAYGNNTDVLIDRDREAASHQLLSQHGLAPELLARFQNGLLYKFIQGWVTSSADLTRQPIWRAVGKRLAEWHAVIPTIFDDGSSPSRIPSNDFLTVAPKRSEATQKLINGTAPGKNAPNLWTVMQKWILGLPTTTEAEIERKESLQNELEKLVKEFADRPGLGKNSLVFGHCDLLHGNVIVHPRKANGTAHAPESEETVSFIDYEYATPVPAAFDIANHFAEWGGFECDYNVLPTKSQRRDFLQHYLKSYSFYSDSPHDSEKELQILFNEVDVFRGLPGFYWGIWALIQATISQIDFDYASYAEVRLGEYWAWRAETEGTRATQGLEKPLRERRWAQE